MNQFTLIILFIFALYPLRSQKQLNLTDSRSIRTETEFIHFEVKDLSAKKKSKFKSDKIYYWYKSQEIITTQGGAGGLLLNGVFEKYYASKQLHAKGSFKNGLKESDWTYWFANGKIERKEKWKKGMLTYRVVYDESGKVLREFNNKGNKNILEKENMKYTYDKDSVNVAIEERNNEVVIRKEQYSNGQLHGNQYYYDEAGELIKKEKYKNGILQSPTPTVEEESTEEVDEEATKQPTFFQRIFKRKKAPDTNESNEGEVEKTEKKNKRKKEEAK